LTGWKKDEGDGEKMNFEHSALSNQQSGRKEFRVAGDFREW